RQWNQVWRVALGIAFVALGWDDPFALGEIHLTPRHAADVAVTLTGQHQQLQHRPIRVRHLLGDEPARAQFLIAKHAGTRLALAEDLAGLQRGHRRHLQAVHLLIYGPGEQALGVAEHIEPVARPVCFALDHRQDVDRVNLGDRTPVPSRHEYAPDHPLDLGTAALGSHFLLNEVLADRTKCNAAFAQLGETLALFLDGRIFPALYELDPEARFGAGLFQRHRGVFAERSARRGPVAGKARDQHEGPDAALAHADAHAPHHVVHDFVTWGFRLQRLEQSVGQCSLCQYSPPGHTGGIQCPCI